MGACFYAAIILLPQRFQAVNGISAQRAGIDLLSFTIVSPVFSGLCGVLLAKALKSPVFVLLVSSALTAVGFLCLVLSRAVLLLLKRKFMDSISYNHGRSGHWVVHDLLQMVIGLRSERVKEAL